MKQGVKKLHNEVHAKEADKPSIETAVEYLIEESLRLGNAQGAAALSVALKDLKSQAPLTAMDAKEERNVVNILRSLLRLDNQEMLQLIEILEALDDQRNIS